MGIDLSVVSLGADCVEHVYCISGAFGFMLHVRGRNRQKFSEACRSLLKEKVDGIWGKLIDLVAIFALIAGTATTFSLATPLLSSALCYVFQWQKNSKITVLILLVIAAIYTVTVWFGMKGVSRLSASCSYLFLALLAYVLLGGGECTYILETGFSAMGNLVQNFMGMATWMDLLEQHLFHRIGRYTIGPIGWCGVLQLPFLSGRSVKAEPSKKRFWEVMLGTFGNFFFVHYFGKLWIGTADEKRCTNIGNDCKHRRYAEAILRIFQTLPLPRIALLLLAVTMIAFYATTFDALTMVISVYSYKKIRADAEPDKRIKTFWAVVFILFPIALIFSEESMYSLQSVSIIAAFPIGIVIVLIIISLF